MKQQVKRGEVLPRPSPPSRTRTHDPCPRAPEAQRPRDPESQRPRDPETRAQGAQVTDGDGHTLTDCCLGDTGAMFGHAPAPVAAALQAQADALRKKEVAEVVAKIKDAISHYGLTAADLGLATGARKNAKLPAAAGDKPASKRRKKAGPKPAAESAISVPHSR